MATVRVTWTETATYVADIQTDLTPDELLADDDGEGEAVWFTLVQEQTPDWRDDTLVSVEEHGAILQRVTEDAGD